MLKGLQQDREQPCFLTNQSLATDKRKSSCAGLQRLSSRIRQAPARERERHTSHNQITSCDNAEARAPNNRHSIRFASHRPRSHRQSRIRSVTPAGPELSAIRHFKAQRHGDCQDSCAGSCISRHSGQRGVPWLRRHADDAWEDAADGLLKAESASGSNS